MKVGLLGGSFDTSNMGVCALAEATVKLILHRWPDAEIVLIGSWKDQREFTLSVGQRMLTMQNIPVRFCKNPFLRCHFLVLLLSAWMLRLAPIRGVRNWLCRRNSCVRQLVGLRYVFDITGGDSFSDIYGGRRFAIGTLRKYLMLQFCDKLILLPQTYGPFEQRWTRWAARYILRHAHLVYSRDRIGLDYVHEILNHSATDEKVRLSHDVAFVLDPGPHEKDDVGLLRKKREEGQFVIGLNVSGLLFNRGYTGRNEFGLKPDYPQFIVQVARRLLDEPGSVLVLIPHEFSTPGSMVDDPRACRRVYEEIAPDYPGRVFLIREKHNQNEIKYCIGLCQFFIGSRMHSCIAALSQHIPAVGLAYSRKFAGVFETIGMDHWAIDLRRMDEDQTLSALAQALEQRSEIRKRLNEVIPEVKEQLLTLLDGVS